MVVRPSGVCAADSDLYDITHDRPGRLSDALEAAFHSTT